MIMHLSNIFQCVFKTLLLYTIHLLFSRLHLFPNRTLRLTPDIIFYLLFFRLLSKMDLDESNVSFVFLQYESILKKILIDTTCPTEIELFCNIKFFLFAYLPNLAFYSYPNYQL